MQTALEDMQRDIAGPLSVAAVSTAKYFLPQLLGNFKRRYPGVEPRLQITNREVVLARIADNADDIYVMGQPPREDTVIAEPFLENIIVFVAPSDKAIVVANAASLSAGISMFAGFNLVFYRNDGVTFGMLGGAPWWSLIALALAICIWLGVMLFRAENAVEALAYGAIIGGALGNVIDRVRYRAVTDFLDFYIGTTHWPAFNMADVFVVGGVGLLLAAPWISARRPIKS